jgi:uncharacterized protein YdeI (YjbR/CyaY-like superfamily)
MAASAAGEKFGTLELPDRAAWRAWLAEHHTTSSGVWLVVRKKAATVPGVGYEDSVEEALCFGWIDSKAVSLDGTRFKQTFTPRKPRSVWSPSNKERVARLIDLGLMMPAGLAAIEVAKANGSWSSYDAIDQLVVPDDLAAALRANPSAEQQWNSFSASSRKGILYYIASAKRAETRASRVSRTVELAAQGLRILFDQP